VIEAGARILLVTAEAVILAPLLYLALLSLGALLEARRRAVARGRAHSPATTPTFALLIPAHDEAAVIAGALASAAALDYPPDLRVVYVVADNCGDQTAAIAREAGATVYERRDDHLRAKGYALRWLLERLRDDHRVYDAYVIVDADSRLSPNFLRVMAASLANGERVVQARYRVHNEDGAWTAGLRAVAFALFNHLRPLGRARFGWSAGLKGNGMCFSRAVIERHGWEAHSLAEDAEFHIHLLRAGVHVAYAPEAEVAAEMPVSLEQARTQQARWERGRLELARIAARELLPGFLRGRDLARLDALMEIVTPPLSMLVGLTLVSALCAGLLRSPVALALSGVMVLALGLHVVVGATLARLSPRAYLSLLRAPLYIAWKCWVYTVALVGRGTNGWVRTQRIGGD
jgi:cellulose synthase/poly-beta-1,6-N-acetylglucosamine synthase-like glycosyltransferase